MTENAKPEIVLVGGGGHCRAVIDVIEQEGIYRIAGIIDKELDTGYKILGNYRVIGRDEQLEEMRKRYDHALVTVGQIESPNIRIKLYTLLEKLDYTMPVIISPRAYVSEHADIGAGSVVMHDALINAGASVGKNCIVNTKSLIEHDAVVEDHCHISTAAVINGGAVVKKGTFFGSGAVSREYVETAEFDFIKATTVFKGCQK